MNIKKLTILVAAILLLAPALRSEQRDSLIVSLVTCWPGPEVYELCGHEAIRIRSASPQADMDSVWNYGIFSFDQPNFIYRFVKGETDYKLAGYPFEWFMPEYQEQGRRVEEQVLNLNQEEAHKLLALLREEAKPENCTYRYNYVLDNCATRPIERIGQSSGKRVIYPDSAAYGTFRNTMRHYHRGYPWYQFGIDICLGSGIDRPINGHGEMFAPVEMYRKVAGAHFEDGTPLVLHTNVLNQGVEDATSGPTPWYLTPIFWSLALLGITALLAFRMIRKRTIYRPVYSAWFGLIGITGCVVAFLLFVSTHEATTPNLNFFWLNPLQLVLALGVWWRSWRPAAIAMAWVDMLLIVILLLVWPWQHQSANIAFFPLMGVTLLLAAVYAIIAPKQSYKYNNEKVVNLGAGSRNSRRSSGAGRRRPTASGGRNRR
ncbi:MAG: DUF4105 domain-containing protein [Muribaculaceae bacterium]|nr:DUF4105 domain-containing protein [Muribaculaceae bacterium]